MPPLIVCDNSVTFLKSFELLKDPATIPGKAMCEDDGGAIADLFYGESNRPRLYSVSYRHMQFLP